MFEDWDDATSSCALETSMPMWMRWEMVSPLTRKCELVFLVEGRLSRLFGFEPEDRRRSSSVPGSRSLITIDLAGSGVGAASSLRSSAAPTPCVISSSWTTEDNIRDHRGHREKQASKKEWESESREKRKSE